MSGVDVPEEPGALDEVVSAVLDGEATPAERARVMADPRARARLKELALLRDRLRATATLPGDGVAGRDRVALALAASDADPAVDDVAGGVAEIPVSAGRRSSRNRPLAAVGALVAAAVVVVVGIGVATTEQPDDLAGGALAESDTAATSSNAGVEASRGDTATTGAAPQVPGDEEAPAAPTLGARGEAGPPPQGPAAATSQGPMELGRADDAAELLERFHAARATEGALDADAAEGFGSGGDGPASRSGCAAAALATGFVGDRRIVVVAVGDGFAVVDATTCARLAG